MARSKEQKDQLKSLVDQLRSEGLSTDEIQARVDEQKALFDAEQTTTVEVTDEIQEPVTEGKTSDVATVDAAVTSKPDTASESTESDSANTLLELQKDVAKYGELDTSRDAILARRRLSRFEDKLISSQTIDLEEVVVTGFGDNTPITREEWSKLDNRLKNQNKYKDAFAKGELTKADIQRAQYEGYVGEESGARSLIDNIANANANIPEQEITNKTYEVYFEKTPGGGTGWIDAPVDLGTTTATPGGTVQINRRAATKEEKEQRIYDAAIAANLNDQGAKDYVALYNQYQDKGTLNPLNDYQKESIPTANQQALYTIENRNKELVANNYNEDVQDLTSVLLKETPEGQDLDKVKNDLKVGGSTLVARQEQYNNDFNVLAPKIEKINDAIQVLDKDIETYKKRLQDFAYPVTSTGQETGNNIYNKLQQKVNERNAIATGPEAQALQEENLKLADQGVQILKMQQQYNVNLQKYDDLKDLDQTLVALDKDYRFSTRTALNIEQSFGGSAAIAGAYTARAAAFLTSGLAELTQSGASGFDFQNVLDSKLVRGADALIGTAVNYNQAIEEKIQALPAPITVDEVRKGKASGWAFISDSTASAAPTLLTIAGPQLIGGLVAKGFTSGMSAAQRVAAGSFNKGLGRGMAKVSGNLFGLQTGGQTLQSVEIAKKFNPKKIEGLKAEIEKTKDPIVKRQLENQIVSLENSLNKSTFQTGVSGLVTGFITKYSEQAVTLKLFDDFNRVAKNIGKNKFIKELKSGRILLDKDAVSKAWIPQTLELGGVVGGGLIKENAQESLESILDQGIVRNIILGENVNVFEEINEDLFANTSFATLLMLSGKTINNANAIIKEHVTSNSELGKYQSLTRQLIEAQDLPTPDRIKKSKEILLDLGLQDIVNISKLNTLTPDQIKEIGEIEVAIKKITRDANTLANSTTGLPTESEIKSLQNLQEQSDLLKNRKNDILSVRSKRNQEFIDKQTFDIKTSPEIIFHLNLFESSNIMADAMVGKGNEIYFFEEDTADLEKFKGRTISYTDDNGDVQTSDAFKLITSGSQNAYAFDNVVVIDANISKRSILRSITNSDGKFAAVTALHEVSHLRNKNKKIKFTGDSAEALTNKKAVTEAINMLDDKLEQGSITQNDYDAIKKRLAQYENDGDYEEFMQVLSDAVNLGILNKGDFNPDSVLNSFKGLFNNITNKIFGDQSEVFVQFNTGSDVYNYIDSFKKQAMSGVAIADVDGEDETTIKASKAVNDLAVQYKNNKEAMSEQDISNLQDQYQRLGIDALQRWAKQRGVPLQVDENVISDINNQFESVMKNYTPTNRVTGKPMQLSTYVGNILGRRVGPKIVEDYTRRTGQSTITQAVEQTQFADETAEQAFEIEERAQAEESGRSKLIDVRKSPRVKKVLPTLEKEIKITEGDSSVEILNNNRSKFASEIYNVPEGKIEKVDNLTYSKNKPETSELGRIQQDFSNAQETERSIKTMPEFNVTTMESTITEQGERVPVSPEVRGRSMKIGQTVLDFFYEPYTDPASESTDRAVRAMAITNKSGRSKGETTQTKVYRLKPEFRPNRQGKISPQAVSKAREWAGIDVDLNELSKNERRNYATKLAAWARMRGGQVALSVADKSLPESATKQQRADTRAGRSRLVFSKAADIINVSDTFNLDYNAKDKLLETFIGEKSFNLKTEEGVKEFVEAVKTKLLPLMPKEFWFGARGGDIFTPSYKVVGSSDNPKLKQKYKDLYNNIYLPSIRALRNDDSIKYGKPIEGVNDYSVSAYSNIFKNKDTINKNIKNGKVEEWNKKVSTIHREMWKRFDKAMVVDGKIDKTATKAIANYLGLVANDTGHWHKLGAQFIGYSDQITGKRIEYEHAMPATMAYLYLLDASLSKADFNTAYDLIIDNYKLIALDKAMDDKLRNARTKSGYSLQKRMPDDWSVIDGKWWQRYFNNIVALQENGIDPKSIIGLDGRNFEVIYGINAEGKPTTPALAESKAGASVSNNNKLMPVARFSKKVPNPTVLNRMGELDADAKQANKEFYDSVDLNKEFNDILEVKTGIASEKRYKRVKAEVVGANKGRFQFFIPPSAEDFTGLLYSTLAKGKLGDAQMAWYKKNLLDPYGKAMNELSSARIAMFNDYKQLKKELEIVPKDLRKKVPGEPFTREQAVRVYIWQKQGMTVPGISEADMQDLSEYVANDTELQLFAEQLINIQKGDQYAGPKEGWPAGTITTDMLEGLNTTKRAKALEQWQTNADEIFSEENLNKLEAAYGKPYRLAMENMLQRMKSGRNRNFQGDTLTGRFTDWVTGSIGTIMFFNTRSALLQTISSINFVNFTDNNILAAGKAFANQKQFWSDFMTLMNSDFLKERRGGLRINVSEADIADMAKKGGAKGVINKLLEFGFTPTQIADSFAIASGGSAFYRNRIKTYKKQGMTDAEAEAQAFVDFRETAEESQQSSRPDRISMQQAGPLGRLVLAFANTPAQYARLIKKAASDLKNGRGDAKTNISKIIYYGVAQNLLFNALQQALFAFAFDDDEEDTEEQQKKYVGIANGMMDSLLRGMGLGGAVVSVGKNSIIRIINEMEKKQPKLEKVGYEITKLSPPISAKLSRINQAARSYQWDKKDMMEKGWSLDNPAYLASANVIAALTNIPLDRAIKKTNNVVTATSQDLETWERLALLGGWQDWEIGIDEEKPSNKPQPRKTKSRTKKRKTRKR